MHISAVPSSLRRDLIDAAERRGAYDYANHFEVGYSRDEVLLRFAQVYLGSGIASETTTGGGVRSPTAWQASWPIAVKWGSTPPKRTSPP